MPRTRRRATEDWSPAMNSPRRSGREVYADSGGLQIGEKVQCECPICGGSDKLTVERRSDGPNPPYWINCWNCKALGPAYLGAVAEQVGARDGATLMDNPLRYLGGYAGAGRRRNGEPVPLPSLGHIAGWHERLLGDDRALNYLERTRGLTLRTIKRYQLGYDGERKAITLPVFDAGGEIVNLRRRFLDPGDGPKIVGLRGHLAALYPDVPVRGPILLCEGEFDALIARQHGLPAVTSTAGTTWKPPWDVRVKGRRVAVAYDAGSFDLAEKQATDLRAAGAEEAWAVDLASAGLRDGEDLTNWFVTYGRSSAELLTLIRRSERTRHRARRAA